MIRTKSANPFRNLAWTFLLLSLAVFLLYSFARREYQPLTDEMQQREAAQRAHYSLDSN